MSSGSTDAARLSKSSANLLVLSAALNLVEKIESASVGLCYIDPPLFPTIDYGIVENRSRLMMEHLLALSSVLQQAKRCLSENGNIFVHSVPEMNGSMRLLLDQVFGRDNFRQEIILPRPTRPRTGVLSSGHDTIFHFSVGSAFVFNPPKRKLTSAEINRFFVKSGELGPYRKASLILSIPRPSMGFQWRGYLPPKGKSWRFAKEKLDQLFEDGRIEIPSNGSIPTIKQYASESSEIEVDTVWTDMSLKLSRQEMAEFPTQKPVELLARLIEMGSCEGDLVLDPFCGSGTTLVAASQCKRKWIGGDILPEAINLAKQRLGGDHFTLSADGSILDGYEPLIAEYPKIVTGFEESSAGDEYAPSSQKMGSFVLNQYVPFEEDLNTEFKEIISKNPARTIVDTVEDYIVSFLNGQGGRILWGIRDKDRSVVGVSLDYQARDEIRKGVAAKVHDVQPAIDPSRYTLEFYPVSGIGVSSELCVVGVSIDHVPSADPYYNHSGEAFVRINGVKQKLIGTKLTAWIKARLLSPLSVSDSVTDRKLLNLVARIKRVFSEHGIEHAHLARFLELRKAPFSVDLRDLQSDATFLHWLDEAKIDWISHTFLIRREWIDGEDERIHEQFSFDKQPARFFSTISQHLDVLIFDRIADSPCAYFLKWGTGKDWKKRGESRIFVVLAVPIGRLSNERTVYKYLSDFTAYPWDYPRARIQLRAWTRLLNVSKNVRCVGRELSIDLGNSIEKNSVFLRDVIEKQSHAPRDDWHPEDYALYPKESAKSKEAETFSHVIDFLKANNLPWEETNLGYRSNFE